MIKLYRSAVLPMLALSFAALASAQTPPSSSNDETVKLDEFNVSASSVTGYTASESMTGTRIATKIKDLPFSINVVTNNMMQDFGIFEINEDINQFVPNFNNLDQGGGYNMRGFNASFQLRDGFIRLGRYSSSNIDRIEFIMGSNAAIYGQASPGGLVNMISKAPKKETTATINVSQGNLETDRETAEATGTIAPNTYFITDLGLYEHAYQNQYGHVRNHEFYLSVKHDFSPSTSLTVQYEYADRLQHSPHESVPVIQSASVKGFAAPGFTAPAAFTGAFDKSLANIDELGPYSLLDRSEGFLTGIFQKRFNSVWNWRTAANRYWARRWDFGQNMATSTESVSTTGVRTFTRGANPNKTLIIEDGGGVQSDLVAHYHLFNDKINARTLVTFDFNDYYRYEPTYNITGSVLAQYWTPIRTITVGQPIGYYLGPGYTTQFPYANGNGTLTRRDHNRISDWGSLISQQLFALNDRLKFFASLRTDYVILRARDTFRHVADYRGVEHAYSPSVGVNYEVTPSVALFANRSNGFNSNEQSINATSAKNFVPPEKDYGYDYGIKVFTPDQKFTSTIDAFYIKRSNVVVHEIDPFNASNTISIPGGDQLVRGWEWTASYSPTSDLSFTGFWGHINSRQTNLGTHVASVGRSPAKITPDNLGLTAKYQFGGPLKGLATFANWSYEKRTPLNNADTGDSYNSKTNPTELTTSTYQWNIFIPSYWLLNWGASYTFACPFGHRLTNMVRLNINNVTSRNVILTTGQIVEPRSYALTYELRY